VRDLASDLRVIPKPYRMEELRMRLCPLLGMHST
jgi:hypothetical protein